jgi:hypothetical protein
MHDALYSLGISIICFFGGGLVVIVAVEQGAEFHFVWSQAFIKQNE